MPQDRKTPSLTRRGFAVASTAAAFSIAAPSIARAQAVEIEYWQYFFKERVEAMDELIKQFEAANPGIRIKHTHFPYAQYRTKTAAAVPAGEGPTVMQLFFGWMREYAKAKLIQPLPTDMFKPADVDRDYFDVVKLMKNSDGYWALPTAVRSLGMFYNKRLFKEANLGEKPAATLEEYVKFALATAKHDGSGNLTQAGATIGIPSQDYHWWREVLVRQHGGKPYSEDFRKVTYADEAGAAASPGTRISSASIRSPRPASSPRPRLPSRRAVPRSMSTAHSASAPSRPPAVSTGAWPSCRPTRASRAITPPTGSTAWPPTPPAPRRKRR